jgi:hypothetical protein
MAGDLGELACGLDVFESVQAFLRGVQLGIAAAFLFDEIIFDASAVFRRLKNRFPIRNAFAE